MESQNAGGPSKRLAKNPGIDQQPLFQNELIFQKQESAN